MKKFLLILAVVVVALLAWAARGVYAGLVAPSGATIPETVVRRGTVAFTIQARGELQGGNSEMLFAPMAGGGALAITELRESGDLVEVNDIVARFDTTEQEFRLREAQADLAEAEQQVTQAKSESAAKQEEINLALLQARSELELARIEMRRNELLPRINARQNELAVGSALGKVTQLEKDLSDRIATAQAGVAIQEAARQKAQLAAETAKRNIDSMTLRAKSPGYVARQQNQSGDFNWGSYLPALQVGDTVRAGMAVAQIPDLKNWEITARIGELDRGHLAIGQASTVRVVALPGKPFTGKIKTIGGTTGPPWNRSFETRVALDNPTPELRPGMSVRIAIDTGDQKNVLWLPGQALFDSDGRKLVYLKSGGSYTPKEVKLVRRSESQVVVEGLSEGQIVALANPDQMKRGASSKPASATEAIKR